MSDLISRESVIEIIESVCSADDTYWQPGTIEEIRNLPTHPTPSNTLGALDCVSRQAAIDAIDSIGSLDTYADREYARGIFNALPSVPRKGKWIIDNPHSEIYRYACSECHAHHRARYDFCPSCGSYNGGEQTG